MKVYIETTIPSYLVARPSRDIMALANQQVVQEWWTEKKDFFDIYISEAVLFEVSRGDSELAKRRLEQLDGIPILDQSDEIGSYAEEILKKLNLPEKARYDAIHIAYAVYYEIDILLTLNCKHLANASVRAKLKEINLEKGYITPDICTPQELMEV